MNKLQQWQEEILKVGNSSSFVRMNGPIYETFDLKPQHKKMIEELLFPTDSNPYWVHYEYRRILQRVLNLGFYGEGDREALNYARECYLKGRNWIK